MLDQIDRRLAELENEMNGLKRRKLELLQAQVAAIQESLSGSTAAFPRSSGRFKAATTPRTAARKRGRPRGKRISDSEALEAITKMVAASGKEGVPARQASISTGLSYPRVMALMKKNFKKTGSRKSTRYHLK